MPLYLDDIRKEFAEQLASNSSVRFSMDKALAHVVTLAYQRGIEDAEKRSTKCIIDNSFKETK